MLEWNVAILVKKHKFSKFYANILVFWNKDLMLYLENEHVTLTWNLIDPLYCMSAFF